MLQSARLTQPDPTLENCHTDNKKKCPIIFQNWIVLNPVFNGQREKDNFGIDDHELVLVQNTESVDVGTTGSVVRISEKRPNREDQ